MKVSSIILLSVIGSVTAGLSKPSVSVNLQDGCFEGVDGLDPLLSWSTSASAIGCDFEGGVTSSVKATTDVMSLPRSIWGKISSDVAGWRLSSRADVPCNDDSALGLKFSAGSDDLDASINVAASGDGGIGDVSINKNFDALGGTLAFTPRYNVKNSSPDVTIGYGSDNTSVLLEASTSKQKLTVSQMVTDDDIITPSVTSSGDVAIAWKRSLSGGNAITTTVKVNDSINVKWEDGPWTAAFDSPLDGISTDGVNVHITRKLSL